MPFTKNVVIFSLKHKKYVCQFNYYTSDELLAERFSSEAQALEWLETKVMHMDIGHFHTRVFYTVS